MSMFIQNNLIRWILQPLAKLANRIPEKLRNVLFVLCFSGILCLNILNNTTAFSFRYLYVCAFDCLMIGIMLLCTLPQEIKPIRFDWKLFLPWLGFCAFMLIAGITKSSDYLANTVLLLVMFPIIFLVWASADFSRIVKLMIQAATLTAGVFFVVCLVFFPITGAKYEACFTNVNEFAFFLSALFVLLLMGFLNNKITSVWRWVDLLLAGICWAFTYYSNSRTGQLACLMVAACMLVLLLIQQKQRIKSLLWDVLPVILVLAISASVVLPTFVGVRNVAIQCQNAIVAMFEKEEPIPSDKPTAPGTQTTIPGTEPTNPGTQTTKPSVSVDEIVQNIDKVQGNKTNTDGKTLNQLSTGRVEIWKAVLKHITFWGHGVDETFTFHFDYRGTDYTFTTAHMTILDFAYDFGLLAGVFYLLFNLVAGVKSIVFALRQPKERWMLAPFAVTVAYACISLLASTVSVFSYMIALLYYLMQAPLMLAQKKD